MTSDESVKAAILTSTTEKSPHRGIMLMMMYGRPRLYGTISMMMMMMMMIR